MTIEKTEAKIDALEEKLEALGDVVNTLVDIIADNLKHDQIGDVQRDLASYNLINIP